METHVYEALVNNQIRILEQDAGQNICHGAVGTCPGCGHVGVYDLKAGGVSPSSIYFSVAVEKWCCMSCGIVSYGC